MEDGKRESEDGAEKMKSGYVDEEAMKKCLEENKGDNSKCKPLVEAFNSFPTMKPVTPLMLRPGSLTDV